MSRGRYAEACPKLEESQRLDPGIGTQYNLAECYARTGRTASAWAAFLEAAAAARVASQPQRERRARERAAELEPRLSRLTIEVRPPVLPDDFEVRRNGAVVGRAQWSSALPVDPGTHTIVASAPGKKTFTKTVEVASEGDRAVVVVPALEDAPRPPAEPPPPAAEPPRVVPAEPDATTAPPEARPRAFDHVYDTRAPSSSSWNAQRTVSLLVAGVGVAGVGVGTYFGLRSKDARDDSRAYCSGDACTAEGVELRRDALRDGNISTMAFGVGAVALGTGAVLWFTAPKRDSRGLAQKAPTVSPHGLGLRVSGTF